jgi:molybdopterin synthase sulfur carrier subunit
MNVTVSIPLALLSLTGNASELNLHASTVEELVMNLDRLYPGFQAFILDESKQVRRFVNIFVNEDEIRSGAGLLTKLKDGDRVRIIPAVAGG